jgi:ATP-binding cassette, subfamily B, bacterial
VFFAEYRQGRRERKASREGAFEQWKSFPRIFPYLGRFRKLVGLSFLLTIITAVVGLAAPWPLAMVIDSVIGTSAPPFVLRDWFGSSPDPYRLLVFIVGLGFLIVIVSHGLRVINDYVNAKIEQNMVLGMRSDLFAHVQQLSLTFHDDSHTGQLMSQINFQAASVGSIAMAFPPLFESLLMLIGMLIIALLIDWQVTLLSLVAVPIIYYAIGLYGTRIVPRIQRVQGLEWRSLSIVFEAMSMLRVIVSFGRERHEHYRFVTQGQMAVDARVRLTVWQTLFSLGVTAATAAGTALVLGLGASHVLQEKITLGELTVLISYIAAVYQPLESISHTIGTLHQQFVFFNAAVMLLETEPEVTEAPDAVDIGRSKGQITVENLSFSYRGRVDTLKDISFEAKAGQRIAIVGPTGAGKTTLASLLVRFYDPAAGHIMIDGVDIKKLKLRCLRNQLSLVLQEPLLFSGSIGDNIRYGRLDATMDDIVAAAKAANAHDFIEALPEAYETELGERGAQLSGGERQRICVARAFIRNAPILILDEPTSSIDSRTETVILDALELLMEGRTSIMIAHRLSTIRKAELILVVNHGRLVEQGPHEELLMAGGLYYQLYEAQNGDIARIEADHLRNRDAVAVTGAEAAHALGGNGQPVVNGNAGEVGGGDGIDQQVLESLAAAVRQRIRGALSNGGQQEAEPNGADVQDGSPGTPAGEPDPPLQADEHDPPR